MESYRVLRLLVLFVIFTKEISADTPANCTYGDIEGKWIFSVSQGGHDKSLDCQEPGPWKQKVHVKLMYPDIAVDEYENEGHWTLIYNQGFEVTIHGRKYFAFSKYKAGQGNVTSYCDETLPGWSHDVLGHDWACFVGKKDDGLTTTPKVHAVLSDIKYSLLDKWTYHANPDYIKKVNLLQSSWTAVHYPEYEGKTAGDLLRRAGGPKSRVYGHVGTAPLTDDVARRSAQLPEEFDWRNVDGISYVSPVRNQGGCGSCYSFASMGMLESRLRIISNNTIQVTLSPQDVVDCSKYSQGCDGGFPYLIAGKYAEDFGAAEESCDPYTGEGAECSTAPTCQRHYATHYSYVGGYYGGCNEELMKLALYKHGPLAVGFEVYNDFMNYQSGIYQHTGLTDKFNPFEQTNHAVLVVGYGVDKESGLKFWSVKNSWGTHWGEDGYFRILRGVDEVAIESMAVQAFPIF